VTLSVTADCFFYHHVSDRRHSFVAILFGHFLSSIHIARLVPETNTTRRPANIFTQEKDWNSVFRSRSYFCHWPHTLQNTEQQAVLLWIRHNKRHHLEIIILQAWTLSQQTSAWRICRRSFEIILLRPWTLDQQTSA